MACVWTYEQMPGDTTAFLINEFKEYNEVTGLTEFKLYDRYQQHWFEVKDGNMTVGYDLGEGKVIYLYHGKLDGSEGDITEEYAKIKQENWPTQNHHTLTGMAHGDMRRIVAKLNFLAKDVWKESGLITLVCDHSEQVTTLNGKVMKLESRIKGVEISGVCNYPLEIIMTVGEMKYRLSCHWNHSFTIHEIDKDEAPIHDKPIDTLTFPRNLAVMKFIKPCTKEDLE